MCLVDTRCNVPCGLAGMVAVIQTQLEIHFVFSLSWSITFLIQFVSSLAWDEFGQRMLRYISFPRWHRRGLFNTGWVAFCVLAGKGGVWSTRGKMHFVFSLKWEGFGQHMLRYILCPRLHEMDLVNTSWDTFCVIAGMGGFGQHMLGGILCFRRHGLGLFNTRWDTSCVLACTGGILSTHFEIHFVSSLT
jgi:hypothetical protein